MGDMYMWVLLGFATGFVSGVIFGLLIATGGLVWTLRGMARLGRRIKEQEQKEKHAKPDPQPTYHPWHKTGDEAH